jgi:hypothetical protein
MCDHQFPGRICIPDPAHIESDGNGIPVISLDANTGDVFIGGPPGGFGHRGRLILTNAAGEETYAVDGETGTTSQSGDIVLLDAEGNERIRISGQGADMTIKNADEDEVIHLDGITGAITVGENGQNTILLDGSSGEVVLGGPGRDGDLAVKNTANLTTIRLDGQEGTLALKNNTGRNRVELGAEDATLRLRLPPEPPEGGGLVSPGEIVGPLTIELNGDLGQAILGGVSQAGSLITKNEDGENTIDLDGQDAEITAGAPDNAGRIRVQNREGINKITLNGQAGRVSAETGRFRDVIAIDNGGTGQIGLDGDSAKITVGFDEPGDIFVRNAQAEPTIHLSGGGGDANPDTRVHVNGKTGNMTLGGHDADGDLRLCGTQGKTRVHLSGGGGDADPDARIHIDGAEGDIIFRNADCAEEFEVDDYKNIEPGSVLVISSEDRLTQSTRAYDKRVAGIVSGAGDYKPGIVLDRQRTPGTRLPVTLMGKVYCKVDARRNPIKVGDLLTTSDLSGHAMKAADPENAIGAIIGKALKTLPTGTGLLPVLVALQ